MSEPDPARPMTASAGQPESRPHIRYLDGLRGVAILAVLMVHTGQIVPGLPQPIVDFTFYGVRGVQLFFIVSGLTLTLSHASRPFRPLDFARRRFLRIAPMFYLGAILYLALAALTTMPLPTRDATALDVVVNVLFVHGWVPHAINTVVPGGWSIAAEAMFYVTFPLILMLVPRPRRLAAATAATYVVAGLTNIALRRWFGAAGAALAFPFWLVQLPAFATGCWLATLDARPRLLPLARVAMAIAVVGLVVDSQLRGRSNLLVAILLLGLLVWAVGLVRPRLLDAGPMPFIGRISFSLYILQFAVLDALRPLVPAIEAAVGVGVTLALVYVTALLVTGALSTITFTFIEQPAIRAAQRWGRRPLLTPRERR